MRLLKRLFGKTEPVKYRVHREWLPPAKMQRIILHWTGGSYTPSSLDKEHYHFLITGEGEVVRGKHLITANEVIGSKSSDDYAAHTLGANTGAIGISICSMAGATENGIKNGKFPLLLSQWSKAAEVIAHLCEAYGIEVTDKTVLTHAEVQPNLGIRQNGKWDIARLPFSNSIKGAKSCGDDLRRRVKEVMAK